MSDPESLRRLRENAAIAPDYAPAGDVDVPEWAQSYSIGDKIAFDDPRDGVQETLRETVIGFSTFADGLPVVRTPEELEPDAHAKRLAIPPSHHVLPEEVAHDA